MKKYASLLLLLISVSLLGQSEQKRNWEYSKVAYASSKEKKIVISNSLPKGGGIVQHNGNEYNYFIFWTNVHNDSPIPLDLKIKFPTIISFESNQLKELKNRISPSKNHLFYSVIFIHKTKWPVRAEYILKDKKLFYKITAGTNVVMVPCGGINS